MLIGGVVYMKVEIDEFNCLIEIIVNDDELFRCDMCFGDDVLFFFDLKYLFLVEYFMEIEYGFDVYYNVLYIYIDE